MRRDAQLERMLTMRQDPYRLRQILAANAAAETNARSLDPDGLRTALCHLGRDLATLPAWSGFRVNSACVPLMVRARRTHDTHIFRDPRLNHWKTAFPEIEAITSAALSCLLVGRGFIHEKETDSDDDSDFLPVGSASGTDMRAAHERLADQCRMRDTLLSMGLDPLSPRFPDPALLPAAFVSQS